MIKNKYQFFKPLTKKSFFYMRYYFEIVLYNWKILGWLIIVPIIVQ